MMSLVRFSGFLRIGLFHIDTMFGFATLAGMNSMTGKRSRHEMY